MTLTIHHLQVSQSERLVWLCEELDVPYELILHHRDPVFSPPSIKALHPMGQAPIIQDDSILLAESCACVEYIVHVQGRGRLVLTASHNNYADFLYWFHLANSNLQPLLLSLLLLTRIEPDGPTVGRQRAHLEKLLSQMDHRLSSTSMWLAGDDFTCADIMTVFSLTTMRVFYPLDLSPYPAILAYLKRITQREAYRRARSKADPELELMTDGKPPTSFIDRLKAK